MLYPDGRDHVLAHELGHFFSLRHTFEAYVNINPSLNCNRDYDPKGEAGKCASCASGRKGATCSGAANVMDYCTTSSSVFLNSCQQRRAAKQRKKYMTHDGGTDFFQMKGTRGEKRLRGRRRLRRRGALRQGPRGRHRSQHLQAEEEMSRRAGAQPSCFSMHKLVSAEAMYSP